MHVQHFILATAGHVDHGKSSLVKALTGIDPDRLPEEKARGITIDLGFAHLELSTLAPRPSTFHCGIVDVPGHEDFVKNMVAGVGSIDLALFIVAADDGWMPQSEEHLQILSYLGVSRGVVALTKIDLAEGRQAEVVAALRGKLAGSPFADAPIVPTSVVSGRGIDELRATLARALAETPPPRDLGKPRLPVDRVFTLRGVGTVVTGTLTGGTLRRGQAVVVQPSGQATRLRSVQNHNLDVESSPPGTRTAVNLPDVEIRSAENPQGIGRGDVITLADFGQPADTFDVVLEKSARLIGAKGGSARPLKDGTTTRVHLGSANFAARVALLDQKQLEPGQRALAQLRFEAPVFAFAGDCFIVRDWAEQTTLAGGVVLNPDASRRHFHTAARRQFLARRAQGTGDALVFVRSQLARDGAVARDGLLAKSRFSAAQIQEALARLIREQAAVLAGALAADGTWWRDLRERAAAAIDAEHRAHPERPGLALSDLRAALPAAQSIPGLFDALVADLCRGDFRQTGATIQRAAHRPELPPQLQAAGAKVRAALGAKPIEPPSRKELAPDALSQQALRFLLQTGEAVELSQEIVLAADAYARAVELICAALRQQGKATASDLRAAVGTSRRILIPLLEKLDREGVTLRQGDFRVLRVQP
jgi:selenocysteine-specific elongation factor